jgi:hypothetical protein
MAKAMILFFDSDKEARILKRKVVDGHIIIEGKQFHVDTAQPLLVKKRMGYTPLYILKWDAIEPSNINIEQSDLSKIKNIVTTGNPGNSGMNPSAPTPAYEGIKVNPKFKKSDPSPELYRKAMGMKVLGNIIPVKKDVGGFIWIIFGLIAGACIMFSLQFWGVI